MTRHIFFLVVFSLLTSPCMMAKRNPKRIICNPLELNYMFQQEGIPRREAADPVGIYFKDNYYIFASKSYGYWTSKDMVRWTYIPCKTIPVIMDYAPTVMEYKGELYFTVSSDGKPTRFFKNANPQNDEWEEVPTKFTLPGQHDPAFFKDDDGRVYLYWGCSNELPIVGVEVDPEDGFAPIGEPVTLIEHCYFKYGWEVPGQWNDEDKRGWNEGPAVIKHDGNYYLQYAAPGTEFRTYADGYYVGTSPLGPFTYAEESPFSLKTGGFIGGAGHGDTFKDKYGNLWHIATMRISVRHMFERRLGLFPVSISEDDGVLYSHQEFSDYPFEIPDRKVEENHNWRMDGFNLLSRNVSASASSQLEGYESAKGADEMVETWWSAKTGDVGEWFMLDLGIAEKVSAIQVNFADHDFHVWEPTHFAYRYKIEASPDGKKWKTVVDMSSNNEDAPHKLHLLKKPVNARYIRITNCQKLAYDGKFSLYDLRVFGGGEAFTDMAAENVKVVRNATDPRRFSLTWDAVPTAKGYIVHWGIRKDRLTHSSMVFENKFEAGHFNIDSEYFFEVTAFGNNNIVAKTDYDNPQAIMEKLKTTLKEGNYSCVVYNNGVTTTYTRSGVADLYDLVKNHPSVLKGSMMVDKIVGKGAASLMILGGVTKMHTRIISGSAVELLEAAGVEVSYEEVVDHIINRSKTDWCPLEKRVKDCKTAQEALPIIEGFIKDLKEGKI